MHLVEASWHGKERMRWQKRKLLAGPSRGAAPMHYGTEHHTYPLIGSGVVWTTSPLMTFQGEGCGQFHVHCLKAMVDGQTKPMQTTQKVAKLSIAPMLDWTDRHYRFMMRQITKHTRLYTEMLVDQTLLHQLDNIDFFLGRDPIEAPLAIQLGGNHIEDLGRAATVVQEYGGFCEVNLNVGCPSPLVSSRCFGARLMLDPQRVHDICASMIHHIEQTSTNHPQAEVTVKCRIGVDDLDSYEYLYDFIDKVSQSGVTHFIVHSRKCLLNGLSPHENRTIPPLKYDVVYRLKEDFPHLLFTLNGGVHSIQHAHELLQTGKIDGVMIGRAAYNTPWDFRDADRLIFNQPNPNLSRREVIANYLDYADAMQTKWGKVKERRGEYAMPTSTLMKPLLCLFNGDYGGKAFKRHIAKQWSHKGPRPELRELIESALSECIPDEVLDARVEDERERAVSTTS